MLQNVAPGPSPDERVEGVQGGNLDPKTHKDRQEDGGSNDDTRRDDQEGQGTQRTSSCQGTAET
jgi:hypothetical protein